ncbi:hypothetical protein V2J09_012495 [Rumex salicifolius]
MATHLHSQPPWMSTLKTSTPFNSAKNLPKPPSFRIRLSSPSNSSSTADDTPSPDSKQIGDDSKNDRVNLAFNKALEYKKLLRSKSAEKTVEPSKNEFGAGGIRDNQIGKLQFDSVSESPSSIGDKDTKPDKEIREEKGDGDGKDELPEAVRIAMEKAKEYKIDKGAEDSSTSIRMGEKSPGDGDGKDELPEAVRLAKEKAKEYKKNKDTKPEKRKEISEEKGIDYSELIKRDGEGKNEPPEAVRVAMEKAKEYKKNKGEMDSSQSVSMDKRSPGDKNGNLDASDESDAFANSMEKAKEYKMMKETMSSGQSNERNEKLPGPSRGIKKELKVSKMDFIGLDFSDKKQRRGLPPGLVPTPDPFQGKDLPEIEMIIGDASKFGNTPVDSETTQDDVLDLYKPKVSTWGVFPRPSDISKAYGGGRTLRPGETLETEEVKAAKEARTKQLLAEYKARTGLNVNPKLKAECGKALKDGDELMDVGKLKDALPYYQEVMDKMPFQTELHGLAALQWAICQDSLNRSNEAQGMYKKLKSHPNSLVNKKASQFAFSFEAMEMLKVRSSPPINPGYETYFDAFVKDNKPKVTLQDSEPEEAPLTETLPYIVFLVLPVLLVLLIAAKKGI